MVQPRLRHPQLQPTRKGGGESQVELEREAYLLVQPLLVTVKYRPVIGEVGVEDLLDLHVQQDLPGLLLHDQVAEGGQEEAQSVRSNLAKDRRQ